MLVEYEAPRFICEGGIDHTQKNPIVFLGVGAFARHNTI
jgi:hypothetical protein